jgi:hypothetical protein
MRFILSLDAIEGQYGRDKPARLMHMRWIT